MSTTVRIDSEIKEQVTPILNSLGISLSQAINMYLHQIKLNNGIPLALTLNVPVAAPDVAITGKPESNILTREKICEAVRDVALKYQIEQVYLFGSYARGDATEKSDCDFRIVGGNIRSLFDLGGLYDDLNVALGREVDIVMTKNMTKGFYNNIKEDEVLIYGGI
jgi:addiction module RelB/DinJ family antitoxin